MITENLSTLKIHKMSDRQYKREYAAGNVEDKDVYLTPDTSVLYTPQTLSKLQQAQARANLGIQETGVVSQLLTVTVTTNGSTYSLIDHTFEQLYAHSVNNGLLMLFDGIDYYTLAGYNDTYMVFIHINNTGLMQAYKVLNDNSVSFLKDQYNVQGALAKIFIDLSQLNDRFVVIQIDGSTTNIDYTSYELLELVETGHIVSLYNTQSTAYYPLINCDFYNTRHAIFGCLSETGYLQTYIVDENGAISSHSETFAPCLIVKIEDETATCSSEIIKQTVEKGGSVILYDHSDRYSFSAFDDTEYKAYFTNINLSTRQINQIVIHEDNAYEYFTTPLDQFKLVDTLPDIGAEGEVLFVRETSAQSDSLLEVIPVSNSCFSYSGSGNAWYDAGYSLYSGRGYLNSSGDNTDPRNWCSKIDFELPAQMVQNNNKIVVKLTSSQKSSPEGCIGILTTGSGSTATPDLVLNSPLDNIQSIATSYAYKDVAQSVRGGTNEPAGTTYYFIFDVSETTLQTDTTYSIFLTKNDEYASWGWCAYAIDSTEITMYYSQSSAGWCKLTAYQYQP